MTTITSSLRITRRFVLSAALLGLATFAVAGPADESASDATAIASVADGSIPTYQARFGRQRPIIAVVGENSGTELTDFVIPYGVLAGSGVAEVVTVSTQPGALRMRPALTVYTCPVTALARSERR